MEGWKIPELHQESIRSKHYFNAIEYDKQIDY